MAFRGPASQLVALGIVLFVGMGMKSLSQSDTGREFSSRRTETYPPLMAKVMRSHDVLVSPEELLCVIEKGGGLGPQRHLENAGYSKSCREKKKVIHHLRM